MAINLSRKMGWTVGITSLLVLIPSLFFFYFTAKQVLLDNELEKLQHHTQFITGEISSNISLGETDLSNFADLIGRKIPMADEMDIIRFETKMALSDDGIWRNNPDTYVGTKESGLFLPSDNDLTPEVKRFYGEMLNIFNSFGIASNNNKVFSNIWYLGHDRSEIILDSVYPDFIYIMKSDNDYRSTDWMTLASPERNPLRQTKWTPPLFDPVTAIWIVSAIHPLDIDGKWLGTLGHDMPLTFFFRLLESINEKYKDDHHFLRDDKGHFVLAGPWQKQLEQEGDTFVIDPSELELQNLLSQRFTDQAAVMSEVHIQGKSYQAISVNISPMNWSYLNLIPTCEIIAPLNKLLVQMALIMVFVVLLTSVLINSSVRLLVVKPIEKIVARTRSYANGEQPENLNNVGSYELSELVNALDDMHDDLEQESADLAFMATHDVLTGLPNRKLLDDRLEQIIAHVKRTETKAAVLFLDLDEFKAINDALGHSYGDKLLKMVSERISFQLREQDTVARFGGDEFVIVLSDFHNILDVSNIAEKILFVVKQPYLIEDHDVTVTGSIGISLCPDDSVDAEKLIQNADTAMYLSKGLGRNAYQFYTKEIHQKVLRKHQLEDALHKAVDEGQFVLYYQPKLDLKTKRICGLEALVRWQHPTMGLVPPDEFIPLAEETGLIVEIGDWVVREACTKMKQWHQKYEFLNKMSINISVRQFQKDDFIKQMRTIFIETQVDVATVDFEITESMIMHDVEHAISILAELKALGLSISIDDFGTGYSSLSYLKRLPADYLKIDRAFVKDIVLDLDDKAITKSIIALADNMGLGVVAEGIEDAETDTLLTSMGCGYAQGYFFSKPLAENDLLALLSEQ